MEGAPSHGPGDLALSPEVGSLGDCVYPSELLMTCEFSKVYKEFVSRIWDFSLKTWSGAFPGASVSAPLIFQEPCEQLASIYGQPRSTLE